MSKPVEERRCHVCGHTSIRRVKRPFEYDVSHDGRPPITVRIPDLEVVACTNPGCRPDDPADTVLLDGDATQRITEETCRQLGLLTPAEIRAGRERLNMTQQQLQELLGLGGNSLSRWESGRIYQSRAHDRFLRVIFDVPKALAMLQGIRHGESGPSCGEREYRLRYIHGERAVELRAHRRPGFDPRRAFIGEEPG